MLIQLLSLTVSLFVFCKSPQSMCGDSKSTKTVRSESFLVDYNASKPKVEMLIGIDHNPEINFLWTPSFTSKIKKVYRTGSFKAFTKLFVYTVTKIAFVYTAIINLCHNYSVKPLQCLTWLYHLSRV